jgi:LysR family hydrogen peroxide-inducible transcriptional activator
MSKITLKHLRYFEALARHGHFARAAEACAISQPALSVQVRELEALLGAPLVERSARSSRLTALGEMVAARAREILLAVDELGEAARFVDAPLTGRLRIGVIPTVAPYLLPEVIRHLARRHPGLDLFPREAVTPKLTRDLLDGHLDLAIVALPISEPRLHEEPLFSEEFVLVRPLADRDEPVPPPEVLPEMRLLLLEEGHCFRDQALSFCRLAPARSRDLMEGSSLTTLVRMVGAGIGVTLIPEMAVAIEARNAPVSVVRLEGSRPRRTIGMVWRQTNPIAGQLALIAERVREVAVPGWDTPPADGSA